MWLETDRLRLRRFHAGEVEVLLRWHGDAETMRFMSDGRPHSRAQCERWIATQDEHWEDHGFGLAAVTRLEDDEPIGWAGLSVPAWLPSVMPGIEVGWLIDPHSRERGLATEAATAWIDWGFQMLAADRILAISQSPNHASLRVMEKLGMHAVGPLTHPELGVELLVHTVNCDAWRARSASAGPLAPPAP